MGGRSLVWKPMNVLVGGEVGGEVWGEVDYEIRLVCWLV